MLLAFLGALTLFETAPAIVGAVRSNSIPGTVIVARPVSCDEPHWHAPSSEPTEVRNVRVPEAPV